MSTQACNAMRADLTGDAAGNVPARQQKLRQMVRAELGLMRSVAIKLGGALLVLEGLFRLAAAGYAPDSGAVTVAASRLALAQAAPHTRTSGMHASGPRQPRAAPVPR